jgi:hypothetical protein
MINKEEGQGVFITTHSKKKLVLCFFTHFFHSVSPPVFFNANPLPPLPLPLPRHTRCRHLCPHAHRHGLLLALVVSACAHMPVLRVLCGMNSRGAPKCALFNACLPPTFRFTSNSDELHIQACFRCRPRSQGHCNFLCAGGTARLPSRPFGFTRAGCSSSIGSSAGDAVTSKQKNKFQ